jgi:hypothetical protein
MSPLDLDAFDPRLSIDDLTAADDPVFLLGDDTEGASIDHWGLDEETPGWLIGIQVVADHEIQGTLVVSHLQRTFGRVHPATARLFRYSEEDSAFDLDPFSGAGLQGRYTWGRISAPGSFAVIGMDSDPVWLRTLTVLSTVRDMLVGADADRQQEVTRELVDAILRTPFVEESLIQGRHPFDLDNHHFPGVPALPIDVDQPVASVDQLQRLAKRAVDDWEPPEMQLLALLREEFAS